MQFPSKQSKREACAVNKKGMCDPDAGGSYI